MDDALPPAAFVFVPEHDFGHPLAIECPGEVRDKRIVCFSAQDLISPSGARGLDHLARGQNLLLYDSIRILNRKPECGKIGGRRRFSAPDSAC
jgi:hypothetical protein